MKKLLLIAMIVGLVAVPSTAYSADVDPYNDFLISPEDLGEENYYKPPMKEKVEKSNTDTYSYNYDMYDNSAQNMDTKNAPLFKQIRLNVANKINSIGKRKEASLDVVSEYEKSNRSLSERLKFWKKSNDSLDSINDQDVREESVISDSINDHIDSEITKSNDALSLESGISEHVVQKELMLDSDNITFDDENGDMIATGRPVLTLPQQDTKVFADKMTYNQDSNILKCLGNVVIQRNGMETQSDFIEIDMNEETIITENVKIQPGSVIVNAKKAVQKDGLIILNDGYFHSDVSEIHRLSSRMVGPNFSRMMVDEEDKSLFLGDPSGNNVNINIKELYVEARKNHDVFKAKGISISKNGKHFLSWPRLTAYTNKNRDYFEASYPELGSRRKVGMFLGPGFAFGGPNGSVVKVIPFINYKKKFGIGGALKYRSPFNSTELGYGSANDIFFLRGIQKLDDNLYLQYGANSFNNEWFLGARMPKYMAEVYYDKGHKIPNFLAENKDLTFRHRASFGLMKDNDQNFYSEKIQGSGTTTTRLRYMAEINQKLYSYSRPEDRFFVDFSFVLQGAASWYGTGDTQFIGRVGPRAHIQYKNWMQDIAYFQSGYHDQTPMPRYDMYRYGHSAVSLTEIVRLNKYISIGWSGSVNLSDDSPNGKLFQENRFAVAFGPDDLKIRIGYDFVRQTTYFGFDVAFDTKGTTINYGKMEIKNPERLGQQQKNDERKLAFAPVKPAVGSRSSKKDEKSKATVLQYAQVIDLEDPDKERVD